uniref:Uncharacterized protein n=1 Tax=Anguilla anguilla TaxID=7936 RepID=A0A0E9SN28_ANGAN
MHPMNFYSTYYMESAACPIICSCQYIILKCKHH